MEQPSARSVPDGLSVVLDLRGRDVLLVGGGPVSARRAASLLGTGARLRVIAPALCEDLRALAETGAISWLPRSYQPGDLDEAWLVHTATGDLSTDDSVSQDAHTRRIFCVNAGHSGSGSARTPGVARTQAHPEDPGSQVTVAVHTPPASGADPGRSARLARAVADALADGQLPLRRRRSGPGRVDLVGGGPGDPGLITSRGRQLLAAADVVVHDRLAPTSLLADLDDDVIVVDVGKAAGNHTAPQEEINRLLVDHAHAGRRVVRLKGGDPFVLGRGSEEVLACREAGVEVGVVPGVTSAFAVPAALGIPMTHRGVARGCAILSAHDTRDLDEAPLRGTLVLLMGVSTLAATCQRLVARGWAPDTPAAVCEDGFGARERRTTGTLATLPAQASAAGVKPPGIIVVGEVVRLAKVLDPRPKRLPGLVLVAHGSRNPASRAVNERLATSLRQRLPHTTVVVSQLDHDGPRPDEALDSLAADGHRRVLLQPLLFTSAYHVSVDLPDALRRCQAVTDGLDARVLEPLAGHPLMLAALDHRLTETCDRRLAEEGQPLAPDALVLASAGTSSHPARQALAGLARRWGRRHGVPAVSAYASAAQPTPGAAVNQLRETLGPHAQIVMGSLFLGPGFLPDQARQAALDAGAAAATEPLADLPEMVEILCDHYRQAANSASAAASRRGRLTCDHSPL